MTKRKNSRRRPEQSIRRKEEGRIEAEQLEPPGLVDAQEESHRTLMERARPGCDAQETAKAVQQAQPQSPVLYVKGGAKATPTAEQNAADDAEERRRMKDTLSGKPGTGTSASRGVEGRPA